MSARPALTHVAEAARVSIKTVSRVLNNSERVKPAMRDHVMAVIRRLGYQPSPTARRLAGYRTRLIGLPFDVPQTHYVTQIQSGALSAFRDANYRIVMHACDARAAGVVDGITTLIERLGLDGLMLPPPFSDMVSLIEALDQARVPFVRIAPTMMADPGRSVFAFEREAAVAMMQYLVGLGHRRIAFISIHGPAQSSYMGYCDGLRDSALPHDQTRVAACDGSISSAIASARTLLDVPVHERPTAIFSASDLVAAGALRAARELGIEVPTQLSIAGFGNDPIATQVWPQLTTSRLPVSTLAELAAKTLLAQLHSLPGPHRTILEPVLLTRRSTAAPFHHAP